MSSASKYRVELAASHEASHWLARRYPPLFPQRRLRASVKPLAF